MKKFIIFLFFIFCILPISVKADNFINNNNVSLNDDEIRILSQIYWDDYYLFITPDEYDYLYNNGFFSEVLSTSSYVEYINGGMLLTNSHETQYKVLKISTVCLANCSVVSTLDWKKMPSTRSYDVMGARFVNTSLIINPTTEVYLNDNKINVTVVNTYKSNGFGSSFKLPNGGENLMIIQKYTISNSGSIYASYQHARRISTLNKSTDFTISSTGYGGVFNFSSTSASYYDAMGGVNISL